MVVDKVVGTVAPINARESFHASKVIQQRPRTRQGSCPKCGTY